MPTALIVEDEPEANKLLAMLVQLRGYQTESAFDGAQALAKLRESVPDVVFLDLMLPDRDGFDVCRALKASGSTSKVPVIIVTARITADNRIESYGAGADDYVPKPYTPDQIFEALDESYAWRDQVAASKVEGEVVLDGRDDGQTLRRLAHLRRLLLARGGIEPAAIDRISTAIRALWSSVDEWARRSHREQVASLAYSLDDEVLTLTVRDEGGWLATLPDLTDERAAPQFVAARFDEIVADHAAGCLRLSKRFDAHSSGRGDTP
jgi:CheY-like chemotaxis protein